MAGLLDMLGVAQEGAGLLGQLGRGLRDNRSMIAGFGNPQAMIAGSRNDMLGQQMQQEQLQAQLQKKATEAMAAKLGLPPEVAADPALARQLIANKMTPKAPDIFGSAETGYYALGPDGKPQQLVAGAVKPDYQLFQNPTTGEITRVNKAGPGFEVVKPGAADPKAAMDLRKEVNDRPAIKSYNTAAPIFESMIKSHGTDTAAGDLDFVYGMAKIFDPDSVVREGEMATIQRSRSIPEAFRGEMARVAGGGSLPPETRRKLLEVARTRVNQMRGAAAGEVERYGGVADRFNVRREDVLPQVGEVPAIPEPPKPAPPPAAQQFRKGQTATNPKTGEKVIFDGQKWVPFT